MNKAEFIEQLKNSLQGLSDEDIKKSLDYYEEMIDDRIEDGMTEEEAVDGLGSIEEIKNHVLDGLSIVKIVKEKVKPKRALKVWEIVLLIVGSPVWAPVLLCLIIAFLCIYFVFWVIIAALYICDAAILLSGLVSAIGAFAQSSGFNTGLFMFGAALCLVGIAILLFFGFTEIAKGLVWLSGKILLGIKKLFVGGKKNEA